MTSSVRSTLESLDFKDEDDLSEIAARNFTAKLENPNGIAKYQVIAAVAQGNDISKGGQENIFSVDLEEIRCGQSSKDVNSDGSLPSDGENVKFDSDQNNEIKLGSPLPSYGENIAAEDSISRAFFCEAEMRLRSPEEPSAGRGQSDHALSDSPCSIELNAERRMGEYAVSTWDSDCEEYNDSFNDHVSSGCSSGSEMDDMDESIIVTCDYIIYQGDYHTTLLVTFSPDGIKIHSGDKTFDMGWKIDDIVSVKSQWFSRVGQALITLSLLREDAVHGQNVSGIIEAKLAVADRQWPYRQQQIMALNGKFMAIWNHSLETDTSLDETASASPEPYFPNFDQNFEEVVYPKGDPDAVSINKRDVDLLEPHIFVNDNIIDFYAKYLKNQIATEDRQRFHFFNSFFFRKLADLDRDPSLAADGKAAFVRVRKWTRKIDIFGKDFIFIPVNFNLHWSLLVICHPGEVAGFKNEDLDKSQKVPCILHMDSIKGTHAGLKNLMQSYLCEEWRERQVEVSEDVSSKFLNLRFVSLELPQQENSFDCGLFLLHYLELFLDEVPAKFNPFKITKHSNFLNVNWFPPLEASLKRTVLQKLISELLDHRFREVSPVAEHGENLSSRKTVDNGNGLEFLRKGPDTTVTCQETFRDSHVGQNIGITLLGSSSSKNSHCVNESGLVFREFFEPGAPAGPLLGQFQSFEHSVAYYSALSPIEEDANDNEHFAYPSNTEFGELTDTAPQACDDSYVCGILGGETSYNPGVSEQAKHKEVFKTPESLKFNYDNHENAATVEVYPDGEDITPCQEMKMEQQRSSPVQCDDHGCNSSVQIEAVQEGSFWPDSLHMCAGDSLCQDNMGVSSNPDCDRVRKRVHEDFMNCDTVSGGVELSGDDFECRELQDVKKLRLASPQGVQESG